MVSGIAKMTPSVAVFLLLLICADIVIGKFAYSVAVNILAVLLFLSAWQFTIWFMHVSYKSSWLLWLWFPVGSFVGFITIRVGLLGGKSFDVLGDLMLNTFTGLILPVFAVLLYRKYDEAFLDRVKLSVYVSGTFLVLLTFFVTFYAMKIDGIDSIPKIWKVDDLTLKQMKASPRDFFLYAATVFSLPLVFSNTFLRTLVEGFSYYDKWKKPKRTSTNQTNAAGSVVAK